MLISEQPAGSWSWTATIYVRPPAETEPLNDAERVILYP